MQTPLLCKSEPRVGVFRPDRRLETKEERDARYTGKRGGVRIAILRSLVILLIDP